MLVIEFCCRNINRMFFSKIFHYLIIIIFAIVTTAHGQTFRITGKVVDSGSSVPIPGASIVIQQTKKGTNSDVEGTFFLSIPSLQKADVTISSVGFLPKTLKNITSANAGQTFEVVLQRTSNQLNIVTVRSVDIRRESISTLYNQQKNS